MVRIAARNEVVRLSLDDAFTSGMARAAAATAVLDKNLNSLSGSSVQSDRALASQEKTVRSIGDSSDRSGKQIDKLSGRLALLAQAASVLGPALVPLGAPLVGVMAGMTAQLGAVAGAVGVSILAFKGLGEGMKSLNAFQLEPTAENLQKMRLEFEKLGPSGVQFAKFIDGLGPELKDLQFAARDGLFPGVEEGITALLPMLPKVRDIITEISTAMGGLAADAGADLASDDWSAFFDYLDNEAGPILTEFGQTVGNFAQGFGSLLVGLAPLTDDFSEGLLGLSESFASWSAGLAGNDDFQSFLAYVQESGPKAVDLLGQLAVTFAEILTAAAPVGDAVLPVLTKMLDIIGDLADSPLGPIFFTAAAAMSVYSRAAAIAAAATTKLAASQTYFARTNAAAMGGLKGLRSMAGPAAAGLGMVALAYTDLDDKAGVSNTAMLTLAGTMLGPWGAAAGATIGLTMDLAASNDDLAAAIERANNASVNGTMKQQEAAYRDLAAQVDETNRAIDEMLSGRDTTGENVFQQIGGDIATTFKGIGSVITGAGAEGANALAMLEANMGNTNFAADQMADLLGVTARQFAVATGNAQAFSGALAQMNGWLDKRAALREYEQSVRDFGKALRDGFQPEDVELLDQMARGIEQVATQIKNPEIRADFMANALASLERLAGKGPKAQAAIQKVIDKFVQLGLMEPVVEVDADTKAATAKAKAIQRLMDKFGMTRAEAIALLEDRASPVIDDVTAALRLLDGTRAQTYIDTYRTTINRQVGPAYNAGPPAANGTTVPKTGKPYADRHPYLLADGEEVISNRFGQADRHRSLLKAINAGRLAGGGTAGGWQSPSTGDNWSGVMPGLQTFNDNLQLSGVFLRNELRERKSLLEKEQEAGKARLDMLKQERAAIEDAVSSAYATDVFGKLREANAPREGSAIPDYSGMSPEEAAKAREEWLFNQSVMSSMAGRPETAQSILTAEIARMKEAMSLLRTLRSRGLNGPAFMDLAAQGDVDMLQQFVEMSRKELGQYERLYGQSQQMAGNLGSFVGAELTPAIRAQAKEQRQTNHELAALNKRMERIEKAVKTEGPDRTAAGVGRVIRGESADAARSRR